MYICIHMHTHIYICIHIYTHIHTHVHIYSYTSSTAISTGASNELAQRAMMKMLADEAQRRCARETLHCSEVARGYRTGGDEDCTRSHAHVNRSAVATALLLPLSFCARRHQSPPKQKWFHRTHSTHTTHTAKITHVPPDSKVR